MISPSRVENEKYLKPPPRTFMDLLFHKICRLPYFFWDLTLWINPFLFSSSSGSWQTILTNYVYNPCIYIYTRYIGIHPQKLTTRILDFRKPWKTKFGGSSPNFLPVNQGKPRPPFSGLKPHGALRKKVTCGSFNSLTTWKLVTTSGGLLGPKKNSGPKPPWKAGHILGRENSEKLVWHPTIILHLHPVGPGLFEVSKNIWHVFWESFHIARAF